MSLFSRGAMCVPLDDQENIMYLALAYCYQECGSYMQRQGTHRAPVVAICERNCIWLHIAAPWYLFLPRKQKRL